VTLDGRRVLVTGGAGFIGSHIVDDLVSAGAQVVVYDNFSSGVRENLVQAAGRIRTVEADVLDLDALVRAADGCDVICHQAAQLEITKCIDDAAGDLRCNTEGTLNVLEAARRCGVPKVVYASSACVYGQAAYTPQDERHPTVPNWPYGVSKLAAEHYARLYPEYYGIETIGLRYSIVYGPREWFGRVLTVYLKRALAGEPPVVWGGTQERDFVFVSDVVACHRRVLDTDGLGCEILNVSTGVPTTIRALAAAIARTFGLAGPIDEPTKPGEVSSLVTGRMRLPAELRQMVLSPARAAARVGWTPVTDLATGLSDEIAWLRAGGVARWTAMHY
jgi:UDP-glucose 4-epimerase